MKVITGKRVGEFEQREMIEMQGDLLTKPQPKRPLANHFFGQLERGDGNSKHVLVIERKKLLGKDVKMRKQQLVLKKTVDGYAVVGVLEKKVLFRSRPTPIEFTPTTPITPINSTFPIIKNPSKRNISHEKKMEFINKNFGWKKKMKKKKGKEKTDVKNVLMMTKKENKEKSTRRKKINPFLRMMNRKK